MLTWSIQQLCGMVFICPYPIVGVDYKAKLKGLFSADLKKELDAYRLGQNFQVVSQSVKIKSNWKLVIDTFGEIFFVHPPSQCVRSDLAPY